MNSEAERLLTAAKGHIEKGEEFYRQAAAEIVAAKKADPTLSNREAGEFFGHGEKWVRQLVAWGTTSSARTNDLPFSRTDESTDRSATRKVLREVAPEQIAEEILNDPAIRANVGKALDRHYQKAASETTARKQEKEIERHGGEEEHAAFQRRQRITEVVSVARGLVTGMRFVVGEVKRLNLNEFEEAGVIDELVRCGDEVEGFAVLLRQFLAGAEITDADLEAWIGGAA